MTSAPPAPNSDDRPDTGGRQHTGWTAVRFRWWNLLLLIPLIAILPPLFNVASPALAGMPFFYWFQMAIIPIGIACTVAVHRLTRAPDEEDGEVVARRDTDGAQR